MSALQVAAGLEHAVEFDATERRYYKSETLNEYQLDIHDGRVECSKAEANLVGSLCHDGKHRPMLDLDVECRLVPSSTPGHYHLYIEHAMEQDAYLELVTALGKAGLLGRFYVKASLARGQTFCRPEWVKKPALGEAAKP